jgi:hypothetical protein
VGQLAVDLVKPSFGALEEPVGFDEFIDERFGDGVLGVIGFEPMVGEEFQFFRVFAGDEDLFGAAAVGHSVEG